MTNQILLSFFYIFVGSVLLATAALYMRQAIIVAYIFAGYILGQGGVKLIADTNLIQDAGKIGIIFLLFLLGMNLSATKLYQLFNKTIFITLICTFIFSGTAMIIAWLFSFPWTDIIIIGVASSLSSTIIGLKLLPTTALHHRHIGGIIISILLLQDIIAIVTLLVINGYSNGDSPLIDIIKLCIMLPVLGLIAWLGHRFIIFKLFSKFNEIQEYTFLLTLAWCISIAQLSELMGLSYEIGAFAAGVTIASNPLAMHLGEVLKPLRDFFLILFFFALGSSFDPTMVTNIILPAITLAVTLLIIKPVVFRYLLIKKAEPSHLALEAGTRLGQLSEFSLLIVMVALQKKIISDDGFYFIQLATIISFLISTYWIVSKYPSPISSNAKLRRD